jgi:hypothetical protein
LHTLTAHDGLSRPGKNNVCALDSQKKDVERNKKTFFEKEREKNESCELKVK